eukprot:scaffold368745_cov20-Prasinocladus_malaysianus.AAC.1
MIPFSFASARLSQSKCLDKSDRDDRSDVTNFLADVCYYVHSPRGEATLEGTKAFQFTKIEKYT